MSIISRVTPEENELREKETAATLLVCHYDKGDSRPDTCAVLAIWRWQLCY